MALYNEILVGRYNRFLQKFLGMKGPAPAPQVAAEISATWSLFHGVENRYLEGWFPYSAGIFLAASVGNINQWQIRNPAGSNVVMVFEKVMVFNAAVAGVQYIGSVASQTADLGTLVALTASRLDNRGNPQPTAIFSTSQPAAATNLANTLFFAVAGQVAGATSQYDYIVTDATEFPLLPGDALRITSGTANNAGLVALRWRERFLEDSERA